VLDLLESDFPSCRRPGAIEVRAVGARTFSIERVSPVAAPAEPVELAIRPDGPLRGAAALDGPLEWATATGAAQLGRWTRIGLGDFSGILRYQTRSPSAP
jgi:hypothetical protein